MQPEPCCQTRCRYSPRAIRRVLSLLRTGPREVGDGYVDRCSVDELESVLTPLQGYDADHLGGFGPNSGPTWVLYAADMERAKRAGHRTPEAMAAYLCPFWEMGSDEDDLLEAA